MNLVTTNWTNEDFDIYRKYLLSLKNTAEKVQRRTTIINTKMEVLAIYSKEVKEISNYIFKETNYISFLNNVDFKCYEETMIYGNIISKTKDFQKFKNFLKLLSTKTDNWATVDNIKFTYFYKNHKDDMFNLSTKYLKDKEAFNRRYGILMLFDYINDNEYNKKIFDQLNNLINEEEYYVNIAASWLLCEMFIKQRKITLSYFENHKTNKFIINKGVQKCRESFRVSDLDKELLLKYKVK